MRTYISFILLSIICANCSTAPDNKVTAKTAIPLAGTWKLLSGTTIEKNDSTFTDYTRDKEFIKIINDTHFAFLAHDLTKGKDSTTFFSSGGGTYSLNDSTYTEHLQYCSDRQWEGNSFEFIITINGDTLVQKGLEKIDSIGVNRINIEKYVRLKK